MTPPPPPYKLYKKQTFFGGGRPLPRATFELLVLPFSLFFRENFTPRDAHCFWWFKNLYRGQLFNFWSSAFLFFPQNFTPRDAHCFWQWASKNWGWVVAKSALKKFTLLPCMKVLSVEKWHLHICICSWVLAVLLSQSWTIPFLGIVHPTDYHGWNLTRQK